MSPPKPPIKPPTRADTRDERTTKSPPAGLYERLAGVTEQAVPAQVDEETTNPNASDFEQMKHRAERAAKNSHAAATNSVNALQEISQLRDDAREDIKSVNVRLDGVIQNVSNVTAKVEGVLGKIDGLDKTVGLLITTFTNREEAHLEQKTIVMTSELKINEAQQIDVVDARKDRRKLILTIASGVFGGATLTTIISLIISKC